LIFPVTRPPQIPGTHNIRRVSEQESRVLLTEWFEDHGFHYSIETPTSGVYQQSGSRWLSARTDITVYGSINPDPSNRVLNIELKAGRPPWESFRKDFEKLLRERVHGLWFHTIENAHERIWSDLEKKIRTALERQLDPVSGARNRKDLSEAIENAHRSIHFVFCVLETGSIERSFTIDFSQDWRDQLATGFSR
jgi:plasmid stabilization system protein ParE